MSNTDKTIDILTYQTNLKKLQTEGYDGDLFVQAARLTLNDPEFIVSKELRQQLKQLAYGAMYNMGAKTFFNKLKQQGK